MVDVCGTGKDDSVNAGDLRAEDVRATVQSAGVRTAIVVMKPGNAGGAKGGRIANSSSERLGEERPPEVPAGDKQGGEARRQHPKAERRVWSEKMLAALAAGVKGNKWFSLIDKVGRMDTLERAREKSAIQRRGKRRGSHDGGTLRQKQPKEVARLERANHGRLLPAPAGETGMDTEAGERREATVGNTDGA